MDETKSEASSSVYSTTTDFIFYDSLSTKRGADPELQPTANALTPQLSFTKLKRGTRKPRSILNGLNQVTTVWSTYNLLQEDALVLIENTRPLKRLAERTKEAMAVAKFQAVEIETALSPKCRENSSDSDTPILAHCRSTPHGLRMLCGIKWTLESADNYTRLRSAASFHIRPRPSASREYFATARAPTPADKLGMKALFMEKAKRNVDEILEVYKKL
ncbi:hypothetical protein GQ600_2643 [Phytophthora cactorum]|nr:hypothetical protein GQ600_2643 [Phytophthora cactorum]